MIPDDFGSANRPIFSATPASWLSNLCHNVALMLPSFQQQTRLWLGACQYLRSSHDDLTDDIDKLLAKVGFAAEKMATLRRHYGTN